MFSRMSLKYRIALIIFILEAVMMAVVLQKTLSQSYEAASDQISSNEMAVIELVSGLARSALITEEYAELQPYIENTVKNTAATHIVLSDYRKRVVVSNFSSDIGEPPPVMLNNDENLWRLTEVKNNTGSIGTLAIKFSKAKLTQIYNDALNFGVYIAITGMGFIAAIGVLVGILLTRRLERITVTAERLANGDYSARTNIDGGDEIGRLSASFDKMVQHLINSRKNLQEIMDYSPAVIYVKDTDGRYIFINKRWSELFDKEYSGVIGKTDYDIFPKEFADKYVQNDRVVLNDLVPYETEEVALLDDGPHTYVSVKFPLLNGNNKVHAICGISTDITERIEYEKQLKNSQKMEALGKLTGGIAHDYNNMLGVILGFSELINNKTEDQPVLNSYAMQIQHAAQRGANLTSKLLNFTRHKESNNEVVNINSLLNEEKDVLKKTLTARIDLAYQLQDDLWPVILDKDELEDAILNICINAMHAINDNGTLTISTNNVALSNKSAESLGLSEGEYILLGISDTGCGMSEETKEKIFDPFYTTKGELGTGLGLSQVYGFIKRNNGAIKVNSVIDVGSQFILYFPRAETDEEIDIERNVQEQPELSGSGRILVVDDEPSLNRLNAEILQNHGYKVICAESGEQALEILQHEPVDMLISDLIMPKMDGYTLAEKVREMYPSVKLQLVSGYSEMESFDSLDESLKSNMLYKPLKSEHLLLRVREMLS